MPAATFCKQSNRKVRFCAETAAFVVTLVAALSAPAAVPVMSRMEMIGGERGLALTLGADAAFPVALRVEKGASKSPAIVYITCSNIVFGLGDYRFTSFPRGCQVKQIVAHEIGGENAVELSITLDGPVDKNVRAKQKDGRWVILLSTAATQEFAWSAPYEPEKSAVGSPAQPSPSAAQAPRPAATPARAGSVLEDISIIHRERVEKVIFKLDAPAEMIVKNTPDRIVALFVNSRNGLSHATFKSEKDWLVKSIQLKEVAHGGTMWLGATIAINREDGARPLVQALPDRLIIYSVRETKQCLYLWSARAGTTLSYDFVDAQRYPVDYRHIEQKALTDSRVDLAKNGTFSVGEPQPPAATPEAAKPVSALSIKTPQPPPLVKMVIIKDNVNLRSQPSSDQSSEVSARLSLGAVGVRLGKKGSWVQLEIGGARGWVLAALAADSASAPATLWKKIEALKAAKEKQEEKASEAKRLLEERAALKREQQLQAQKQREDRLAMQQAAADSLRKVKAARVEQAMRGKSESVALGNAFADTGALKDSTVTKKTEKSSASPVVYQVMGRDPFQPLVQDEDGPLLNIETIELVGILYDASDRIGLFEDIHNKRKAYALREKEPVKNGFLLRILPDKVLFSLTELGIARTYAMKLNKDKDSKAYKASGLSADAESQEKFLAQQPSQNGISK